MLFYSVTHRSNSQPPFWKDIMELYCTIHLFQECYTPPQGAWNQTAYCKALLQYLWFKENKTLYKNKYNPMIWIVKNIIQYLNPPEFDTEPLPSKACDSY